VLESPFFGRATQRVALGERYVRARQGHVQVVVLAGEAGSGKTRLASEFLVVSCAPFTIRAPR
jgi:predicted ATPase